MDQTPLQDCCADEENLVTTEQLPDRTVKRCSVCGRRHFEVEVDAAVIFGKAP